MCQKNLFLLKPKLITTVLTRLFNKVGYFRCQSLLEDDILRTLERSESKPVLSYNLEDGNTNVNHDIRRFTVEPS